MSRYQLAHEPIPWLCSMASWNTRVGAFQTSSSQSYPTLLNSCFAALGLETLDGLSTISPTQRKQWAQYIADHQGEAGLFCDPLLEAADLLDAGHNYQYLLWQFTFFALGSLDALGARPLHPLSFLDDFLRSHDLESWLANRDWTDPWLESNNIMFLISFLLHERERTGFEHYEKAVRTIFEWLDEHQNPETGYWDLDQGASLLNAMAGAFHFFFLYFYSGRIVQHPEQIIDSTLSLQQPDGLFDPSGGGSACLDLDAIDILVKFSMLSDYRSKDVEDSLTRAFEAILQNQNSDGGFCEAKRPAIWRKSLKRRAVEWFGLDKALQRPWQGRPAEYVCYSGWKKMCYRVDESDLWSTWFRSLALALISEHYPGEFIQTIDWHFRRTATLGWHDLEKMRLIREQFYA